MGKGAQRKRDKKRKSQRGLAKPAPLAYRGNKYKTDELVPLHFDTETAVYECFVMSGRRLTDHDVRRALEKLIRQIRANALPQREETVSAPAAGMGAEDFLIWNIRGRWEHFFEDHPHPGRDKVVGVLRTILGSIQVWGSISPTSRGYLRYIEGFCRKLGVRVRVYDSAEEAEQAVQTLSQEHESLPAPPST